MKKILLSFMTIALTIGVVSASAYAPFSTTVQVSGIIFTAGNADLLVTDSGVPEFLVSYSTYSNEMNKKLSALYPGFEDYTLVDFTNTSASEIGLNLKMQLTSAGGNWDELKDKIYMAITPQGTLPAGYWKTLATWNATPNAFGSVLEHNGTKVTYRVSFYVDVNAGNSISGKSLSPVTFVITGTQN